MNSGHSQEQNYLIFQWCSSNSLLNKKKKKEVNFMKIIKELD